MSRRGLLDELVPDPVGEGAVEGEILSFTTARIVIGGTFTLGDGLHLRPGRRAVVLGQDAVQAAADEMAAAPCAHCDELQDRIDAGDHERRELKREIASLKEKLDQADARAQAAESDLNEVVRALNRT